MEDKVAASLDERQDDRATKAPAIQRETKTFFIVIRCLS